MNATILQHLVGYTFNTTFLAFAGATIFFLFCRDLVHSRYKVNMVVSGVISFIAAYMYFGMKDLYQAGRAFPTEMRYIDWLVTTPLMLTQFSLLIGLRANSSTAWKLILSDLFMIVSGYLGETQGFHNGGAPLRWMFLAFGMTGWLGIMVYLYRGILEQAKLQDPFVKSSISALTKFVTFGWLLYPIGYAVRASLPEYGDVCQLAYNVGDMINKIGFGAVVYMSGAAALARQAEEAEAHGKTPGAWLSKAAISSADAIPAELISAIATKSDEAEMVAFKQMQQQLLKQMRDEAEHKAKLEKLRSEVELEITARSKVEAES